MYPSVANQQSVKKSHLWVAHGRPRLGHEVGSPDGLGRVESPQRIGRMDAALPQRRTHFPQVNCKMTNKARIFLIDFFFNMPYFYVSVTTITIELSTTMFVHCNQISPRRLTRLANRLRPRVRSSRLQRRRTRAASKGRPSGDSTTTSRWLSAWADRRSRTRVTTKKCFTCTAFE